MFSLRNSARNAHLSSSSTRINIADPQRHNAIAIARLRARVRGGSVAAAPVRSVNIIKRAVNDHLRWYEVRSVDDINESTRVTDFTAYMRDVRGDTIAAINDALNAWGALKFSLSYTCMYEKASDPSQRTQPPQHHTTFAASVHSAMEVAGAMRQAEIELSQLVEQFQQRGSDWVLVNVEKVIVNAAALSMSSIIRGSGLRFQHGLRAGIHFEHPRDVSRGYMSTNDPDELCFRSAVVFALISNKFMSRRTQQSGRIQWPRNVSEYEQYREIADAMTERLQRGQHELLVQQKRTRFEVVDDRAGCSSGFVIRCVDWGSFDYPFDVSNMEAFEKLNPWLAVNVYHAGAGRDDPFETAWTPIRRDMNSKELINLLVLSTTKGAYAAYTKKQEKHVAEREGRKVIPIRSVPIDEQHVPMHHWVGIYNFNRIFKGGNRNLYTCQVCCTSFHRQSTLDRHQKQFFCSDLNKCAVGYPPKDSGYDRFMFAQPRKQFLKEFIIYYDFESLLMKHDGGSKHTVHVPIAWAAWVVCTNDSSLTRPVKLYRSSQVTKNANGEWTTDAADELVNWLRIQRKWIFEQIDEWRYDIDMSPADQAAHDAATHCYLCKLPFEGVENPHWHALAARAALPKKESPESFYKSYYRKVADHDHAKEFNNYRGAAHNQCNLQYHRGSLRCNDDETRNDHGLIREESLSAHLYEQFGEFMNADADEWQRLVGNFDLDDSDDEDDEGEDDEGEDDEGEDDDDDENKRKRHKRSSIPYADRDVLRKDRWSASTINIPVVAHNSGKYDIHFIIQALKSDSRNISCIMQQGEKAMSFKFENLHFIDSYNFLTQSLSSLADLVKEDSRSDPLAPFALMREQFENVICPLHRLEPTDELFFLLLQKGVYPYEYMDRLGRMGELRLPTREDFKSELRGETITEEEYQHAQRVWEAFDCQDMGEYHDIYLFTDVLLLGVVFERFRKFSHSASGLDPVHYVSLPGFALDVCLKNATPIKNEDGTISPFSVQLMHDGEEHQNMYLFMERAIRGGMSMVRGRYAKCDSKKIAPDGSRPDRITYVDCNNLYGASMVAPQPVGEYVWLDERAFTDLCNRMQASADAAVYDEEWLMGEQGFFLEVDLHVPQEFHDFLSEYPPAPVRERVPLDCLSPFSRQRLEELGEQHDEKTEKLLCTLDDKKNYVVHARNLLMYMRLGVRVTRWHRALGFKQTKWMESYIMENTRRRTLATSDFDKAYFKLLNNAVFGKMLEDVRSHETVRVCNSVKQVKKAVRHPRFNGAQYINSSLAFVKLRNGYIMLNKPIIVGATILELSKLIMYRFFYHVIRPIFGDRVKLLMTDTDSLIMHITFVKGEADMLPAVERYDEQHGTSFLSEFDLSNYPKDHSFYDPHNKAVLGKFKDEFAGQTCIEFVGLRSKMYSCLLDDQTSKRTAKGVQRHVLRARLHHDAYVSALHSDQAIVSQRFASNGIRSNAHRLYTVRVDKKGLSPSDSKLYQVDAHHALPYGHYRIGLSEMCD